MKKAVILLSILLGTALVGLGITGFFLYKKVDESKFKAEVIKEQDNQIRNLKREVDDKDKEINALQATITEKDESIKDLNNKLKKKKEQDKKAKEEAKIVAEKGDYISEDSTGIEEIEGEGAKGVYRTLTVDRADKTSITFSLLDAHGARADDGWDSITVQLNNGKGSFNTTYRGSGGESPESPFKGTIEIKDNKTILLACTSADMWDDGESHIFTKE